MHRHRQHDQPLNDRRATHLNSEGRKLLEGPRHRYMLISEGSEAVVGTDEKIVAGDAGGVVEGWPVRLDIPDQGIPLQLHVLWQGAPGFQGSLMDRQRGQLCR